MNGLQLQGFSLGHFYQTVMVSSCTNVCILSGQIFEIEWRCGTRRLKSAINNDCQIQETVTYCQIIYGGYMAKAGHSPKAILKYMI